MERDLTQAETSAINSLKRLARKWPKSLTLISMGGSLHVIDTAERASEEGFGLNPDAVLADIHGIPNTGGDW